MDITNMDAAALKAELEEHGVKLHHATGIDKLRSTLQEVLDGTYKPEGAHNDAGATAGANSTGDTGNTGTEEKAELTPAERKKLKHDNAMKLIRIVVSPNDPLMSAYPGLIFTVGSSSVNDGRMIKKFVPFNNDEGWHVPNIIFEQIRDAQMQKFKSVRAPNGEKQMQAYLTKKYNVQILDPLTQEELDTLAAAQKARGDA